MSNTTVNPFIVYVEARPVRYLAPFLLGAFAECIITGLILDQLGRYVSTALATARGVERGIVAVVCAVALFQTCASLWDMYLVHVNHFGDWVTAVSLSWPDKMQPVVTSSMSTPVQLLLIKRVTKAWKKARWIWIPLVSLQLVAASTAITKTVTVFQINFAAPPPSPPGQPFVLGHVPIDPVFVTFLVSSAVLDMLTTGLLLTFLLRHPSKSESRLSRDIIQRLIGLTWQAALPPCLCAFATAFAYIAHPDQFWDIIFQSMLGKFYVVSLLVTLNRRTEIIANTSRSIINDAASMSVSTTRSQKNVRSGLAIAVNVETTTPYEGDKSVAIVGDGDDGYHDSESGYKMQAMRSATDKKDNFN